MKFRIPGIHELAHKGEHVFHSSYLAVETFVGHPPLSQLAALVLVCIVVQAVVSLFVQHG